MTMRKLALTGANAFFVAFITLAITAFSFPVQAQKSVYYVASFNIQNLGKTKMSKAPVRKYLAEVVREFDVVAVQEVSDVTEKAPKALLDEINKKGSLYSLLLSPRSGQQADDKSSQEQYAFYYNTDRVEVVGNASLYNDSKNNYFKREPYSARFKIKSTDLTFTVTQIHTQPELAVQEIDALIHVYNGLKKRFDTGNHIIVGDFNAGCSYATPDDLRGLKIRTSRELVWIIGDDEDTNLAEKPCAYDRIIITKTLQSQHHQWGIANWFTDKAISDHWPVWISFKAAQ